MDEKCLNIFTESVLSTCMYMSIWMFCGSQVEISHSDRTKCPNPTLPLTFTLSIPCQNGDDYYIWLATFKLVTLHFASHAVRVPLLYGKSVWLSLPTPSTFILAIKHPLCTQSNAFDQSIPIVHNIQMFLI